MKQWGIFGIFGGGCDLPRLLVAISYLSLTHHASRPWHLGSLGYICAMSGEGENVRQYPMAPLTSSLPLPSDAIDGLQSVKTKGSEWFLVGRSVYMTSCSRISPFSAANPDVTRSTHAASEDGEVE